MFPLAKRETLNEIRIYGGSQSLRGENMRKNTMASLLLAVALGLPLVACEDTKALKRMNN
jgi:hypothetical protein